MEIQQIAGSTRTIGEAQGYLGLPIVDTVVFSTVTGENTPAMISAWRPNAEELASINAGGAILLTVIGMGHPPVMLGVVEKA